uniref:Zinc finger protein 26 n=2 Tax=Cacopsylla melanoneura TaxID=428564 RepID=A0A8D8RES6_9HEMI
MVPSDLLEHCRLCLVKECVSVNIFENEAEIRQLYYKIVATLPVQISRQDDKLPKKICKNCNLKVDELYQFWSLTANSQKTLLQWLHEAEQTTALTKIKCEFDADVPGGALTAGGGSIRMKVEPEEHSSDDERGDFDDYRDDSDTMMDSENLVPENMVNVSLKDGDGEAGAQHQERKPKKLPGLNSNKKKKSSSRECKIKKVKKPAGAQGDDQKVPCPHCSREITGVDRLARHIKKSHAFRCDPCDVVFKLRKELNEHRFLNESCLKSQEDVEKFSCSLCSYSVTIKRNLIQHIRRKHTDEFSILCPECGRGFFNEKELEAHKIEIHGADPFLCVPCNKPFSKIENYRLHQRRYHSSTIPKECKICHKVLRTARLSEHMKQVHYAKVFDCNICGKTVVTEKNYKKHMQLHSDDKPFECQFCRKAFKLKYYLTLHLRTHTGVRPMFECDICHKVLPTDCRMKHMASHNVLKTCLCSVCGAGFVNDVGLKVHMRRHL